MFYNNENNDDKNNGNSTFGDYLVAELYAQIRMLRGFSAELNRHAAGHQIEVPHVDETEETEESCDAVDSRTIDSSISSELTSIISTEPRSANTNQDSSSNVRYFKPIVGPDSEFQAGWWSV